MKLVVLLLTFGLVTAAPTEPDVTTTPLPEVKPAGLQSQLGAIGQGHNLNPSYAYPGMQNPTQQGVTQQQGLPLQGIQQGLPVQGFQQGLPGQLIGQQMPLNFPIGHQFIPQSQFLGQQPYFGHQGQLIGQTPYFGQQAGFGQVFPQNMAIADQGLVGHAAPIRSPGLSATSTSSLPLTGVAGATHATSALPAATSTQTGSLPAHTGVNTNVPHTTGTHSQFAQNQPLTSQGASSPLTGSSFPSHGVQGIPIGATIQPGFGGQYPYGTGSHFGMGSTGLIGGLLRPPIRHPYYPSATQVPFGNRFPGSNAVNKNLIGIGGSPLGGGYPSYPYTSYPYYPPYLLGGNSAYGGGYPGYTGTSYTGYPGYPGGAYDTLQGGNVAPIDVPLVQ